MTTTPPATANTFLGVDMSQLLDKVWFLVINGRNGLTIAKYLIQKPPTQQQNQCRVLRLLMYLNVSGQLGDYPNGANKR